MQHKASRCLALLPCLQLFADQCRHANPAFSFSRVKLPQIFLRSHFALHQIQTLYQLRCYRPNMSAATVTQDLNVQVRVQDYLNDKLQTRADLDNLDALLQNVQRQYEVLQAQVRLIFVLYSSAY